MSVGKAQSLGGKENEKLFIAENKLLNQKNAFPPFSFVVIASVVR